jgi:stage II sporulation SpoAA-like protein
MAIELTESAGGKVLEVRASGKLSADDYAEYEPAVDRLIAKAGGKISILFIMHDFHGWDMGAVWEDTKFATTHCTKIHKIAMVGEKTWEKWMAVVCKPFTMSSIKYFDAGQEDAARKWLAE